jgi:NCAIR mutase (PurE)-related protein
MLPEVEKKVQPLIEKFREEMKRQGYPEGLIEKGVLRAKDYVQGITKFLDGTHPELVSRAQEEMMPEALEHSKKWMEGLYEVMLGRLPAKFEEVV